MKTIHNRVTTSILIFIKHNFSDWLIRIDKICDIAYEKNLAINSVPVHYVMYFSLTVSYVHTLLMRMRAMSD